MPGFRTQRVQEDINEARQESERLRRDNRWLHQRRGELVIERDHLRNRIAELESALDQMTGAVMEFLDPEQPNPMRSELQGLVWLANEALAPPDSEPAESEQDERFSHWMQSHGDIGTFYVRSEGFKVWPRKGPGLDGLWAVFVPKYLYAEADASIIEVNYGSAEEAMAAVDHNWPVRDDEPAEGAGGDDDLHEYPHHEKGDPTVRESFHGGYVWTYCDECGPDVKVDEDGLCIACGRDAAYFGKKHPDDTAQRQDAMLERREALDDVNRLQAWMLPMYSNVNKHWLDKQFRNIRQALSRTSNEPAVPEATMRYIRDTLHFAMSEITERGDFRQQAQECIDELDRAIAQAEQGRAPHRKISDSVLKHIDRINDPINEQQWYDCVCAMLREINEVLAAAPQPEHSQPDSGEES